MTLSRHQFCRVSGLAACAALQGCTAVARRLSAPDLGDLPGPLGGAPLEGSDPARRVLNRAGYGPRPGDVERVRAMGPHQYLEEQLSPGSIEESPAVVLRLAFLDTLEMGAADARDFETATFPEVGKGQAAVELQQAALLRAVYSRRQLEQVMVEFWTDHFNVSQLKGECSWLKTVDDRLIRKHALGRFRDLLSASAQSAAMLFYLDNDRNRRPGSGSGPNENYARELLELHTLGVDGGYSLRDIQEVARCFTGWSYKQGLEFWPGEFEFQPDHHDDGPKVVLGTRIPAGQGVRDGEQVLELVAAHPSTALHLARKLCRRFLADVPPGGVVRRVARVFSRSGGDLKQTLSELLHSEEFQRSPARKLKRPFDYAVSALRILNADTTGVGVLPYLEKMGQLPYKWAMPDGYPDRAEAWTPSLLARWNFALDLLGGRIPDTSVPAAELVRATRQRERQAIGRALSREILAREMEPPPAPANRRRGERDARQWLALLITAPEFQWR